MGHWSASEIRDAKGRGAIIFQLFEWGERSSLGQIIMYGRRKKRMREGKRKEHRVGLSCFITFACGRRGY